MPLIIAIIASLGCGRGGGVQGCIPAVEYHSSVSGSSDNIPVLDEVPWMREPLQGLVYEQLLNEVNEQGVAVTETTPFVVMALRNAPVSAGYPDYLSEIDRCWPNVTEHKLTGERDVGEEYVLRVGEDDLTLKRRPNWSPGELLYVYSPMSEDLAVGRTVGEELILGGFGTGVCVPEPFEWTGESWVALKETAVLDAKWEPGEGSSVIWLVLSLYDVDYQAETVICSLEDDGSARIDLGWTPDKLQAAELQIERLNSRRVEHPELGPVMVSSFQNILLRADNLLVPPP